MTFFDIANQIPLVVVLAAKILLERFASRLFGSEESIHIDCSDQILIKVKWIDQALRCSGCWT